MDALRQTEKERDSDTETYRQRMRQMHTDREIE